MARWQKRLAIFAIALLTLYYGYKTARVYDRRADGFTLEKITSTLPYNPEWDVAVSQDKLDEVNCMIAQPYYYLARGFQCYAFQSQDGKYVLKFVRHQRLRLSDFANALPDWGFIARWKKRKVADGKKRAQYLFRSWKVAFEEVPEETATLFVHPNKTKNKLGAVSITDRIGNTFSIDLDEYECMLQRKARWIEPVIEELMHAGKTEEAKKRIDQIFQLLADCAHKGIQDTDGALIRKHNMGFLDDRAIYIDGGKLARKGRIREKDNFAADLRRLRPLRKWLVARYPELATYFDTAQKEAIERF